MYKLLKGSAEEASDIPTLEAKALDYWHNNNVFKKSVSNRSKAPEFIFYDGPPFANGLPHYGHLLTSYIKDTVARFQTMNGNKVERRFGWDCHGLPAEMEAEKSLQIQGSIAIKEYGIEHFNEACAKSVLRYTSEWQKYITRAGRWVDFNNSYHTMDLSYMESVIWAFKELHAKGLIYEDYRVMPYSWKCETPLSNFETRLDNSYREKTSKSITVRFTLKDGRMLLVWTTTPWTLPSNLAIAVHEALTYVQFTVEGEQTPEGTPQAFVMEKGLFKASVENQKRSLFKGKQVTIVEEFPGSKLVGLEYHPLFPFFSDSSARDVFGQPLRGAFRVLHGDFVTADSGTGIVHIAPAFGEDDQLLCKKHDIGMACPVNESGKYTSDLFDLEITPNGAIQRAESVQGVSRIDTERCYGVPLNFKEHADIIKPLYTDVEIRKHFYRKQLDGEAFNEEILLLQKLHGMHGICRFLWFDKETSRPVGLAGIEGVSPNSSELHYGIMLFKEFMGKGYAQEISLASLQRLGRNIVSAYVWHENAKSVKMLEKLSFVDVGSSVYARFNCQFRAFKYYTHKLSLGGMQVFEAEDAIIHFLKTAKLVQKIEAYTHSYPHCWRTDTPLIYKALPGWFVKVSAISERMSELNRGTSPIFTEGDNASGPPSKAHNATHGPTHGPNHGPTHGPNHGPTHSPTRKNAKVSKHQQSQPSAPLASQAAAGQLSMGNVTEDDLPAFSSLLHSIQADNQNERSQNERLSQSGRPGGSSVSSHVAGLGFSLLKEAMGPMGMQDGPINSLFSRVVSLSKKKAPCSCAYSIYCQEQLIGFIFIVRPALLMDDPKVGWIRGLSAASSAAAISSPQLFLVAKGLERASKASISSVISSAAGCIFDNFRNVPTLLKATHIALKDKGSPGYSAASILEGALAEAGFVSNSKNKRDDSIVWSLSSRQFLAKTSRASMQDGVNWIPSHVKNGLFGKWLENAQDWNVTRNRFWGCPVPVWKSTDPSNKQTYVFGSIQELRAFFSAHWQKSRLDITAKGKNLQSLWQEGEAAITAMDYADITPPHHAGPIGITGLRAEHLPELKSILPGIHIEERPSVLQITNLHRPFIDKLTTPDEGSPGHYIKRVEDVLDCWFESGSMPFASIHYPFEKQDWFHQHSPGDFIVEYTAQTRGWFYTMTVLSVALFDRMPFKNCICHGVVLDAKGQKLSKRLQNYPDPLEVFKSYGSDAMRWFMLSGPIASGGDICIQKDASEVRDIVRLLIRPVYNAYNFFAMYANSDKITAKVSYAVKHKMDVYILMKLVTLCEEVRTAMELYDFSSSCSLIEDFIETLNNWYIRRSKERFWREGHDEDKVAAYNTLYTVLLTLSRVMAPLTPFLSEEIYQNLTKHGR